MKSVLVVGSPRKERSSSHVLGSYLQENLASRGVETDTIQLYPALVNKQRRAALLARLRQADLVILAAPVYVDCQPAPVIEFMELVAREAAGSWPAGQRWLFVSNCGFPERDHNDAAIAIYRRFCQELGLEWTGGLALGAGPMVNQGGGEAGLPAGRPLREVGKMVQPIRDALDLAAEALAAGQPVPQGAQELLDRPLAPAGMYRFFGNLGWLQAGLRKRTLWQLKSRRYEQA